MKHDDKQQQAGGAAGKRRVVVVGGGFGGINLIQRLDKRKFDVTLVDRNNYHSFPPLFYQVASGGLEPGSISFPFRREIRRRKVRGVRYRMGDVGSIDYDRRIVNTDNGTVPYDILVIAAGTTNNYFGNDQLAGKVFTLKSTPEALRCRDEILSRLEMAAGAGSDEERRRLLSFVVVGGGPAGVEIAGALGEVKRWVIRREYPELSPDLMSVTLVEGGRRLLGAMSAGSGDKALSY
ncbi:MAG: FAD-dependent oxidoreductase, partial [Paramuribaculum sp.]|nr:FAD-dependent oxidoreductase [Paramuribaculum sp.]